MIKALSERETGVWKTHLDFKQLYSTVYPKATAFDVSVPNCTFRTFSPCGKYLIAFSKNQHALSVYLYNPTKTRLGPIGFNDCFVLHYEKDLTSGTELLCKDFCLFTKDKRFVLLA
jgi:hypothetical protein